MVTVNQADFARMAGVSRQAVRDAIRRNRVVLENDGAINPERPENRLYLEAHPAQRRTSVHKKARQGRSVEAPSEITPKSPSKRARKPRNVGAPSDSDAETYSEAERRDKIAAADLKEQRLAIQRGEYIPTADVKLVFSKIVAVHNAFLRTLGERIAPEVAAVARSGKDDRTVEIQKIIDDVVYGALRAIKQDLMSFLDSLEETKPGEKPEGENEE